MEFVSRIYTSFFETPEGKKKQFLYKGVSIAEVKSGDWYNPSVHKKKKKKGSIEIVLPGWAFAGECDCNGSCNGPCQAPQALAPA